MSSEPDQLPLLQVGAAVGESLQVVRLVGSGAHGSVYEVVHRFMGQQALKLLHPARPEEAARLVAEAKTLASILHDNVVRVFDAGVVDVGGAELPYITTEFVSGGTLESVLDARIRLEPVDALEIAAQILDGLDAAHSLDPPVVHRDLIPSNVLVASERPWHVKIADFAIAQRVDPVIRLAGVEGVIRYMPPEARLGYLSERSDLYAVGIMLYQMLTGVFPYRHQPARKGLGEILEPRMEPPPAPSTFRTGLTAGVDGLIMKALSPDQRHRFSSAAVFRDAVIAVGRLSAVEPPV